jgi:hypothetical protein
MPILFIISIALITLACTDSDIDTGEAGAERSSGTPASAAATTESFATDAGGTPQAEGASTPTPSPSTPPADPTDLPVRPLGAEAIPAAGSTEVSGKIRGVGASFGDGVPVTANILAVDIETGELLYSASASEDLSYSVFLPPGRYVVVALLDNPGSAAAGAVVTGAVTVDANSGPGQLDLEIVEDVGGAKLQRVPGGGLASILDPGSGPSTAVPPDSHRPVPIVKVRDFTGSFDYRSSDQPDNPNFLGGKTVGELAASGALNGLFSVFGNKGWIFIECSGTGTAAVKKERDHTGVTMAKFEPQFEIRGHARQWRSRRDGTACVEITIELVDLRTGKVIATKKWVDCDKVHRVYRAAGHYAASEFNGAMLEALRERPVATATPAATAVPTATPSPPPTATPVPRPTPAPKPQSTSTPTPQPTSTPAPPPTPTATPALPIGPVISDLAVAPVVPGSSAVILQATYGNILHEQLFTIDWGDESTIGTGVSPALANSLSAAHIYDQIGEFVITIEVCDADLVCDSKSVRLDVGPTGSGVAGPVINWTELDHENILNINDVATDPTSGNVFVLAETSTGASLFFGEPGVTVLQPIWSLGSDGSTRPVDIAFDPTNRVIYVVGVTDEQLPGQTDLPGPDTWLAKLDEWGGSALAGSVRDD